MPLGPRRAYAAGSRGGAPSSPTGAAAAGYLETLEGGDLAARLPADMGRLVARGAVAVFAGEAPA
ncbi:MAG TPA: hypothetical protein VHS27_07495 [Gaiellales bacterium]|nr:hypothetical protein [Gaiellales bacterium]